MPHPALIRHHLHGARPKPACRGGLEVVAQGAVGVALAAPIMEGVPKPHRVAVACLWCGPLVRHALWTCGCTPYRDVWEVLLGAVLM